jgi:hypothetical protein
MKTFLRVLVVLLLVATPLANAAIYQWNDAKGVVHFSDNPDKIPRKYLKKAKKLKLSEGAAAKGATPRAQETPQASPKPLEPGGHPEEWWRQRFAALSSQLKALQEGIAAKQGKLVGLRRKRAIYVRAQDRVAVNAMQAEISADEALLSELLNQSAALEREATSAGVPAEWRR